MAHLPCSAASLDGACSLSHVHSTWAPCIDVKALPSSSYRLCVSHAHSIHEAAMHSLLPVAYSFDGAWLVFLASCAALRAARSRLSAPDVFHRNTSSMAPCCAPAPSLLAQGDVRIVTARLKAGSSIDFMFWSRA